MEEDKKDKPTTNTQKIVTNVLLMVISFMLGLFGTMITMKQKQEIEMIRKIEIQMSAIREEQIPNTIHKLQSEKEHGEFRENINDLDDRVNTMEALRIVENRSN